MTATTPEPIQLGANDAVANGMVAVGTANVYAEVNPSPSPSVVPSWSPIPAGAPVATPPPSGFGPTPTPSPGVLTINSQSTAGAFSLDGTVPIPGEPQNVSPNGYVFKGVALACDPATTQAWNPTAVQGVSFQNGDAVSVNDPSVADIYIDGPSCAGSFANSSESEPTLHVPGGGAWFSNNSYAFMDIATSMWSNQFTAVSDTDLNAQLTASNGIIEIQTHSASYVRIFFGGGYSGGSHPLLFWYDQSGHSLTGSY